MGGEGEDEDRGRGHMPFRQTSGITGHNKDFGLSSFQELCVEA